jgi:hypothetical protein
MPVHAQMPPPQASPLASEEAMYQQQFVQLTNNAEYVQSDEDTKKSKIGDLIYHYVSRYSSDENAPKITGMIIDLPEPDLVQEVGSLSGLQEKIKEGEQLLQDERI